MTPPQSINNGRNIGGSLLLRPEKTEIISARLQDDDIGVVGNSSIDATEHAAGSITDDAGTGDFSIDAAFLEDGLQSCREGIRGTNTPTHCIAGANHNNIKRTGMTGPDAKDEHHRYRKSAHYRHHDISALGTCQQFRLVSALPNKCSLRAISRLVRRSKNERYSITSSAAVNKPSGTLRPSALAVFRLIVNV